MADEEELDALFGSDDDDQPGFREDDAGLTSPQAGGEDSPGVVPRTEDDFQPQSQPVEPNASPEVELGPPMELSAPLLEPFDPSKLRYVKASNILGLLPRPYDRDTFPLTTRILEDSQGRQTFELPCQNTIRFRWVTLEDGSVAPQTNTRIVQWEDGSMQLFVGSEVLDLQPRDNSANNTHLFARHKEVMQGMGRVATRLGFQPAHLMSASHRRLREAAQKRHAKAVRVRSVATVMDPVRQKAEQEKLMEARLRDKATLQRKQDRVARQYTAPKPRRAAMTERFLEEDLDEEPISDADEDGMRAQLARQRYVDQDEERRAEQRLARAKAAPAPRPAPTPPKRKRSASVEVSDEDADEAGGDDAAEQDLSDEEPEERPAAKQKVGRKALVLSDSDDE